MSFEHLTPDDRRKAAEARSAKAKARKLTAKQAIAAKCRECIYDPHSGLGTWREQVEGCPSAACPLWEHRPRSAAGLFYEMASNGQRQRKRRLKDGGIVHET